MRKSGFGTALFERIGRLRLIDRRELASAAESSHLRKLFERFDVDCVFDVGGNVGQYAEMLRRDACFGGLIVTFEPAPAAAAQLRAKARGRDDWIVEEIALSDRDGEAVFNVMAGSQFSSLSTPRHDEVGLFTRKNRIEQSLTVRTESLATALRRLQKSHGFVRPFLKLDTQGFDAIIVAGGADVIREFVGFQSELAIRKIYAHSTGYREALALYEDCGFGLCAFVPNNAGHFPRMVETDCIMVRSDLIDRAAPVPSRSTRR